LEASYSSLKEGKVTLVQKNGQNMEIELKQLSADDQKYAQKQAESLDSPFKPAKPDDDVGRPFR
jgi:hypothetical protein